MKVSKLNTAPRVEKFNNKRFGIISYGTANDYPQKCLEILQSSGTGSHCMNTYSKFIAGEQFIDQTLEKLNFGNLKGGEFRRKLAYDIGCFQGFAIHVVYNGLLDIVDLNFVPFENCRLGANLTDNGGFIFNNTIKIHPDWGQRIRRIIPDEVQTVDCYNSDKEVIKEQITNAGGFEAWNGQIFWYSVEGLGAYPLASFDPVITEMSTEDAISTVKNRSAKNNFIPAGMLITRGKNTESDKPEDIEPDEEVKAIRELQGDEKAFRIMHVRIENDEEKPEWIPIQINDGDRLFNYTEGSVQKNIGKIFGQPPVLRYDLTPGKLGSSQEIIDAYNFYNNMTKLERQTISDILTELMPSKNFEIQPLTYAS